jgi:hypothetical protein
MYGSMNTMEVTGYSLALTLMEKGLMMDQELQSVSVQMEAGSRLGPLIITVPEPVVTMYGYMNTMEAIG